MRIFIAIELPERVKQEVVKIQKEIDRLGLVKGKFVFPENLHLTLKFLGEISESELRSVKDKLENLKFDNFDVHFDKVGVFSEEFVRIVWIGLEGEGLFALQKIIDELLEDIFPKEHNFMAHITIARPKFVEDKEVFLKELEKIDFEKVNFGVDKVVLKESKLTNRGAVYSDLKEVPLVV